MIIAKIPATTHGQSAPRVYDSAFFLRYITKLFRYSISLAKNFGEDLGGFGDRIQLTFAEMSRIDILTSENCF